MHHNEKPQEENSKGGNDRWNAKNSAHWNYRQMILMAMPSPCFMMLKSHSFDFILNMFPGYLEGTLLSTECV